MAAGCADSDDGGHERQSNLQLSGPITGGRHGFPATTTLIDLTARGYVEEEFFVEGEATSYHPVGSWSSDGVWAVRSNANAPFKTRLLVRRPTDPTRANGTILVEWFNVTSLVDVDIDFAFAAEAILREGYVWVGVSAQRVAITSDGGSPFGPSAVGLWAWDPDRYAVLDHPGDAFSYDIFSQIGRMLLSRTGRREVLGGIRAEHLIAMGQSQSAFRLLTYVNAVHQLARVYDGFLIHSRDGGGAPLGEGLLADGPAVARVRSDLHEPVFQLVSETDLFGLRPGSPFPEARQPDTDRIRTWEVAGTAHSDAFYLRGLYAQGLHQFGSFLDLTAVLPIANNGPMTYLVRAAIRHLREWVDSGVPPPRAEPLEVSDGAIIVRDDLGNAREGVRTPLVDVPVATLTGEGLSLIGLTVPFTPEMLAGLYTGREEYLDAFEQALATAVAAGFVLSDDVAPFLAEATLTQPTWTAER